MKTATIENFEMMDDEQKQIFMEAARHYQAEYIKWREKMDSISTAVAFHKFLDETVNKKLGEIPYSCKKGCDFCCRIHNEITIDEAELLVEYAKDINYTVDQDLLERQKGKSVQDWRTMPATDRKCVFLSNGECSVYEHRPATCRKYYVASDPMLCDLDNGESDNVTVIVDTMAEIVFTGMGAGAPEIGLMADMLIKKL